MCYRPLFIVFLFCIVHSVEAQVQGTYVKIGNDTVYMLKTIDVIVNKKTGKVMRKEDTREYRVLLRRIRKVYPIALTAADLLADCKEELMKVTTEDEKKKIMRKVEKQLIKEHGETLRGLYISEGDILLKLIDRETGSSSYDFLKEMRGGFAAGMWQGVAQLFEHDLKEKYDPLNNNKDRLIEEIVTKIERGEL
jgi:hypothetical protein